MHPRSPAEIPQFLHELGETARGLVGVTQPRRVAAVTVSKRVADEMGTTVGGKASSERSSVLLLPFLLTLAPALARLATQFDSTTALRAPRASSSSPTAC